MNTRISFLVLASALTVIFVSCSDVNDSTRQINILPEDGVIRISADMDRVATRGGLTTESLDAISLFVTNATNSKYTYGNVYMSKKNGIWKSYTDNTESTSLTMLWQNASTGVDIIAYSGHTDTATPEGTIDVSIGSDQTPDNAIADADFLYAIAKVTPAFPDKTQPIYYDPTEGVKALRITMRHVLSKLRVNVKYDSQLTPDGKTPAVSAVLLKETNTAAKLSVATGTVTEPSSPMNIKMHRETTATSGSDVTYEAISIPQSAKFSIVLTVDGTDYIYTAPEEKTFEAGKCHILTLTVGKGAVVGSMTTKEWEEITGGSLVTE